MRFLEELEEEKAIACEIIRAEEREKGIFKLISTSVKLGATDEKILVLLGEEYQLSEEEAIKYLQKYRKG